MNNNGHKLNQGYMFAYKFYYINKYNNKLYSNSIKLFIITSKPIGFSV